MNLRICEIRSFGKASRGMANHPEAKMKIKQREMFQEKENRKHA